MMTGSIPLNVIALTQWIAEHRELLKPPVGNYMLWEDKDFIVMIVGGPNAREEFHVDPGAEIFFQLEGTLTLKVRDEQGLHTVLVPPNHLYPLPANVPHCPHRPENSVGLVFERKRKPDEIESFQWYCQRCDTKLHEHFFHLTDIVKELPVIFDAFYADPAQSTCPHCGLRVTSPVSYTGEAHD
jgi:3-hydroxyanthranilate 3,4-dioxygenase